MSTQYILQEGDLVDDKYKIHKVISSSGFSVTYMATDLSLNRQVAIKEYFPQIAFRSQHSHIVRTNDKKTAEYFKIGLNHFCKEGQILARFDHPNIIRVQTIISENGTAYLVMDYENGETLESYMSRLKRPLTFDESKEIFNPLLDGLRAIHDHNLLHLDIRPKNILLRRDSTPLLINFGGARYQLSQASRAFNFLVAPSGFIPNEQYARQEKHLQPSIDIYATGATLYYCLTNQIPPYTITRTDAIANAQPDTLAPLTQLVTLSEYPAHFLETITAAMSMHSAIRPQNIRKFQKRLFQAPHVVPPSSSPCESTQVECKNTSSHSSFKIPFSLPKYGAKPKASTWQQSLEEELNGLKTGKVLFNPSSNMKLGIQERIETRISMNLEDELHHALKGTGSPQEEAIKVGHFMKVYLSGKNFEIRPLNEEEQIISKSGYTEWAWDITPIKSGLQTLHLHITIRLRLPYGEEKKDHPVLDRNINVRIRPLYSTRIFIGKYWQWIITALLIPLIAFVWKTINY